jgi:hypothetical protein
MPLARHLNDLVHQFCNAIALEPVPNMRCTNLEKPG